MKRSVRWKVLASILAMASSEAGATVAATSCNACSDATMAQKAITKGPGDHYIYNLSANKITRYTVECEPVPGGRSCTALKSPSDANVSSTFDQYHGAWLANAKSESFAPSIHVDLPSGSPTGYPGHPADNGRINAYDTVAYTQLNDRVIDYLNNPANYTGAFAVVLRILEPIGNPVVKFDLMNSVVTAIFNDGSTRKYRFDKDTKTYVEIPNSARDAHGNQLPEGPVPVGRTFLFINNNPGYDYPNLVTLLPVSPPSLDPPCVSERWNGVALTCVQPQ